MTSKSRPPSSLAGLATAAPRIMANENLCAYRFGAYGKFNLTFHTKVNRNLDHGSTGSLKPTVRMSTGNHSD